jgi:hypothetical protein
MTENKRVKINNAKVRLLKFLKDPDTRPVRGHMFIPDCYSNCILVSKKKTGKTFTLAEILESCIDRNTIVVLFVGSINADPAWQAIKKKLEDRGITYVAHTSIYDFTSGKKVDLLQELVEHMKDEAEKEEWLAKNPPPRKKKGEKPVNQNGGAQFYRAPEELKAEAAVDTPLRAPRKSKYKSPKYCVVFDDLSFELKRSTALVNLLKMNRHFKSRIIISTQWPNDLLPEARKQIGTWILFRSHQKEKLKEIYRDADMSIPFEEFEQIYHEVTKKPYGFLYYDAAEQQFRDGFSHQITTS